MKDPMIELSATVAAEPDALLDKVISTVGNPGHGIRVEIDKDRRTVAVQGGWWYRGEYEVEPDGTGARLTHRVRNVATWGRWAVPLANRLFIGFRAKVRQGFATFVAEFG
jgi:hypothetical protein